MVRRTASFCRQHCAGRRQRSANNIFRIEKCNFCNRRGHKSSDHSVIAGKKSLMFWKKTNKEPERFYLFPGQGGRAYRRKQWFILTWSLAAAFVVAAVLVAILYLLNRP